MLKFRVRFSITTTGDKSQGIGVSITQETTQETAQEKIFTLNSKQPAMTRNQITVAIGLTLDGVKYHLSELTTAGIV